MDTREALLEAAIVVGAPEDSELIARIRSDDPEIRMPLEAEHAIAKTDRHSRKVDRAWRPMGGRIYF